MIAKKIIEMLKQTNYCLEGLTETDVDWISEIPHLEDMFEWMICTVTHENYIRSEELLIYTQLEKSKKILSPGKIDENLKPYTEYIENYTSRQDYDSFIKDLLTANADVKKDLNHLCKFQQHISNKTKCVENEIKLALEKEREFKLKLENEVRGFLESCGSEFSSALVQWIEEMASMETLIASVKSRPLNESSIEKALGDYLAENNSFDKKLQFVKKQLQTDKPEGSETAHDFSSITLRNVMNRTMGLNATALNLENSSYMQVHINRAFRGAKENLLENVISKCLIAGVEAALEYLHSFTSSNIRKKIFEEKGDPTIQNLRVLVQSETNFSSVPPWIIKDLSEKCETYIRHDLSSTEAKEIEGKISRRQKLIQEFIKLEKALHDRKLYNDVFWLLLRFEWQTVEAAKLLIPANSQLLELIKNRFKKRMAYLNQKSSGWQDILVSDPMVKLIGSLLTMNKDTECIYKEDVDKQLHELDDFVERLRDLNVNAYSEHLMIINNLFKKIKDIEEYLFDSSTTRKLTLLGTDIEERLKEIDRHFALVKCELNSLEEGFIAIKKAPKHSYKQQYKRMWITMTSRPLEVIDLIKKVEQEVETMTRENELKLQNHVQEFI